MLDSKFCITFIGLIIAVCAISSTKEKYRENFWNTSAPRAVKIMREVHTKNKNPYTLQNQHLSMISSNKFVSRPTFQGALSPRFDNNNYGALVRYSMPAYKYQAAPSHPLDMGDMVTENYSTGNCQKGCTTESGVAKCGKGGVPLGAQGSGDQAISENPDYVKAMNSIYDQSPTPLSSLAVGDMTSMSADGNTDQPIIYDRYVYANQKSKLRGLGDYIRGDVACTPVNNGWFNVSVQPHIDLNAGAMNVMGGVNNETAHELAKLQFATSGGTQGINGGVDMTTSLNTSLGAGMSDINVSAFA